MGRFFEWLDTAEEEDGEEEGEDEEEIIGIDKPNNRKLGF